MHWRLRIIFFKACHKLGCGVGKKWMLNYWLKLSGVPIPCSQYVCSQGHTWTETSTTWKRNWHWKKLYCEKKNIQERKTHFIRRQQINTVNRSKYIFLSSLLFNACFFVYQCQDVFFQSHLFLFHFLLSCQNLNPSGFVQSLRLHCWVN